MMSTSKTEGRAAPTGDQIERLQHLATKGAQYATTPQEWAGNFAQAVLRRHAAGKLTRSGAERALRKANRR